MKTMINQLKKRLKPRAVIVGVGNPIKTDDGIGPYIVNKLAEKLSEAAALKFVDAGRMPENHIGKILTIRPAVVIVIDAVQSDGEDITIIECEDIKDTTVSTHNFSLKLFMQQIKEAGIDVFMIGIKPESVALGEGFTPQAKKRADEFIKEFRGLLEDICTN